ncbi:MAG: hypothetical protein ACXWL5_00580 [Candidatus Chromulinivorax sp.]
MKKIIFKIFIISCFILNNTILSMDTNLRHRQTQTQQSQINVINLQPDKATIKICFLVMHRTTDRLIDVNNSNPWSLPYAVNLFERSDKCYQDISNYLQQCCPVRNDQES